MSEDHDTRLRRLHMRSIRRGIKEMDIVLGGFAETGLRDLSVEMLDVYERLLSENDHDIYAWIMGKDPAPQPYVGLLQVVMEKLEISSG